MERCGSGSACDYRIRDAQKYTDPTDSDPDADPDPRHWLLHTLRKSAAQLHTVQ
jgi:hypothetical protein